MIQLNLSKPLFDDGSSYVDSAQQIMPLFNELEKILWKLMTSEGRSEAKLWLCETISSISCLTSQQQYDLFMKLLKAKPLKRQLLAQLLQMIFEKRPHKAGSVLAKKCHLLENFFDGHPRRIMRWFATFSLGGESEHGKGAKALSQFAFSKRDLCWEELEWKGKHGQSPAVVATKPHYFLDLDVLKTVENFLENVPEFWTSNEFIDSLKDGKILSIDLKYFLSFFVDLLFKDRMKEAWEVVNEFLREESFSHLCRHLLIILDEEDLRSFLDMLHDFLRRRKEIDFDRQSYWLEILLCKSKENVPIDSLLLLNALFNRGRQLLWLTNNEEAEEEKNKIKNLVSQICTLSGEASSFASILKESLRSKTLEMMKWLSLISWAIYHKLSKEFQSPKSWESLFLSNGISFRTSDKYGLLPYDGALEENGGSDLDDIAARRGKRKKKHKNKKKKKRSSGYDKFCDDGLLDFDDSDDRSSVLSQNGCWLLSIDGYSNAWSSADLPDYLSKQCRATWIKQAFEKLNDGV